MRGLVSSQRVSAGVHTPAGAKGAVLRGLWGGEPSALHRGQEAECAEHWRQAVAALQLGCYQDLT